jgi:transcriptional regulator with XRE-family HTH domain
MITAEQLRAARAMLRMEQATLAKRAGVSVETVKRIERSEGTANASDEILRRLRDALELAGIAFVAGANGPGVQLPPDHRTIRRQRLARVLSEAVSEAIDHAIDADPDFILKSNEAVAEYLLRHTNWRDVITYQMSAPVELESKAVPRIVREGQSKPKPSRK